MAGAANSSIVVRLVQVGAPKAACQQVTGAACMVYCSKRNCSSNLGFGGSGFDAALE